MKFFFEHPAETAAIMSTVATLFSIITPIVVAVINNRHNAKLRKIDLFYENKFKAYNDFMIASGTYTATGYQYNLFVQTANSAMLVADEETVKALQEIVLTTQQRIAHSDLISAVNNIVALMNKDLDKSKLSIIKRRHNTSAQQVKLSSQKHKQN